MVSRCTTNKIDTRAQTNVINGCANHGWSTKEIWKESSPTQTVFAAAVYSNIMDCSLHVLYISLHVMCLSKISKGVNALILTFS